MSNGRDVTVREDMIPVLVTVQHIRWLREQRAKSYLGEERFFWIGFLERYEREAQTKDETLSCAGFSIQKQQEKRQEKG